MDAAGGADGIGEGEDLEAVEAGDGEGGVVGGEDATAGGDGDADGGGLGEAVGAAPDGDPGFIGGVGGEGDREQAREPEVEEGTPRLEGNRVVGRDGAGHGGWEGIRGRSRGPSWRS
jgi:hypothetical protein